MASVVWLFDLRGVVDHMSIMLIAQLPACLVCKMLSLGPAARGSRCTQQPSCLLQLTVCSVKLNNDDLLVSCPAADLG